jgi:hypothetical protein
MGREYANLCTIFVLLTIMVLLVSLGLEADLIGTITDTASNLDLPKDFLSLWNFSCNVPKNLTLHGSHPASVSLNAVNLQPVAANASASYIAAGMLKPLKPANQDKNWSLTKCFASSPSDQELSRLLPDLTMRNFRLIYLVNPETGLWSECLVRWNYGTWQHQAAMLLQNHSVRALHAKQRGDVDVTVGFKWGFGSGLTCLAKSIVPAVINDRPVRASDNSNITTIVRLLSCSMR